MNLHLTILYFVIFFFALIGPISYYCALLSTTVHKITNSTWFNESQSSQNIKRLQIKAGNSQAYQHTAGAPED